MRLRWLVILALVTLTALTPAMTLAAFPHCALEGAECGSPCAASPTVVEPTPTVVRMAPVTRVIDGPAVVVPAAPIRLTDLPPRPVSSAL